MRHAVAGNRLNRNGQWRKATVRDIAKATLIHQRVCTTKAKAKEARKLVDQLITLGKKGALAHKRKAFAILCDHKLVSELFTTTSTRFNNRAGGYTRIIPLSTRRGDSAQLAYLELTEKTEVVVSKAKSAGTSKVEEENLPTKEKDKGKDKGKDKEKDKQPKAKASPTKFHPKKDDTGTEKIKGSKKIVGGIKKMFTKKPPSTGK